MLFGTYLIPDSFSCCFLVPPPPSDPKRVCVLEKLAKFVSDQGKQFEDVVRERQKGDPQFAFLLDKSCTEYQYYSYRVKQLIAAKEMLQKASEKVPPWKLRQQPMPMPPMVEPAPYPPHIPPIPHYAPIQPPISLLDASRGLNRPRSPPTSPSTAIHSSPGTGL